MAKNISKQINSRFYPSYVGGYPVFKCGGKLQYGFGSWLKKNWIAALSPITAIGGALTGKSANEFTQANAGIIGTVGGAALGSLVGMPTVGASIGGSIGGQVQGNYEQGLADQQMQQQQQQLFNQQLSSNLPGTSQYTPTFANGGLLDSYAKGGIYIKPSKRGTFTAAATKRGMGVQEFASKVMANKEDYSSAMVKKANFARNAAKWKKEYGGSLLANSYNEDNTTVYENGGTHQANPYGGIPIGNNALVEEGEVRFDTNGGESYIFSNKIPYKRK